MSRGWWNSLWIVVVCWSLACSKPAETPTASSENGGKDGSGNAATLMPPDPDDNTGTARVTDKGKVRPAGGEHPQRGGRCENSPKCLSDSQHLLEVVHHHNDVGVGADE